MKQKYVDVRFPTWMIFGEYEDGIHVDIANVGGDILTHIKREEANKIIKWRDALQEVLYHFIGDDYDKLLKAEEVFKKKMEGSNGTF